MKTELRRFSMSEDQYSDLRENSGGYCTACGEEVDGVEPDARRYSCESCGEKSVYGIEELLLMGLVDIEEDEEG